MKLLKALPLLSLALICASAAPRAAAQVATVTAQPNWLMVVGPYPQPGTLQSQEELAVMIWLQRARTQQDVTRAAGESHPNLACFNGAVMPTLLQDKPRTAALLDMARRELYPIVTMLKDSFNRPRPYLTYPVLTPALPMELGGSYPSGTAATGTLYAHILSQFQRDNRDMIMERGALIGNDRTMAGMHWPSDVAAGQALGHAFATFWINQPEHKQLFKACCSEWP